MGVYALPIYGRLPTATGKCAMLKGGWITWRCLDTKYLMTWPAHNFLHIKCIDYSDYMIIVIVFYYSNWSSSPLAQSPGHTITSFPYKPSTSVTQLVPLFFHPSHITEIQVNA